MIAAIYARKSTEQIRVNDDEKSVNAQVESKTSSWREVQGNLKQLYEFAASCHCAPCVVSPTGGDGLVTSQGQQTSTMSHFAGNCSC